MGTNRRDFLRALGIGGTGAVASPVAAWADRIRILGGSGGAEPSFAVGKVSPDFQRFVGGVRVGEARGHGALLVFWLHGAPGPALDVGTLEEARSRGDLLLIPGKAGPTRSPPVKAGRPRGRRPSASRPRWTGERRGLPGTPPCGWGRRRGAEPPPKSVLSSAPCKRRPS